MENNTQKKEKQLHTAAGTRKILGFYSYWDMILFLLILLGIGAASFYLFFKQATTDESTLVYFSDMKVYVREMLGVEKDCFFPYRFYFQIGGLIHLLTGKPELSMALATVLLNSLSIVLVKAGFTRLHEKLYENSDEKLDEKSDEKPDEKFHEKLYEKSDEAVAINGRFILGELFLSVMTGVLFLVSMIFPPSSVVLTGIEHQYLGVFSPTPWHNGTYLAARPFAILSFFWCVKLLGEYERINSLSELKKHWKDYLFFALVLFLTVYTKPSYMLVHLGAAGLVMVYRMIRGRLQNLVATIFLGLCYIPTFIELFYQFTGVYAGGGAEQGFSTLQGESGIGFGFGEVWLHYTDNIFLCILLAGAFPLLVLCFHVRELKQDRTFRFAWQIYAMGLVMNYILYEQGAKKYDFNFCWGYMYGLFFVFLGCIWMVYKDIHLWLTMERREKALAFVARGILVGSELLFLLAHFVCGAFFFYKLLGGAKYD